jgi:hypothetical protein
MSKILWIVCSGVDVSHLWDTKPCKTLREARLYAKELPETPIGLERPYHIERWEYATVKNYWGTEAKSKIVYQNY